MVGLRTQESLKFENFFKLVQKEALKHNSTFFLDSGEGNDFSDDSMEGEDLSGWLIPNDRKDEFISEWSNADKPISEKWLDNFAMATWEKNNDTIKVSINVLP